MDEETVIWARAFRKTYGAKIDPTEARFDNEENVEDLDLYADHDEDEPNQVSASELRDDEVVR